MKCSNCNFLLPDNAKFCAGCGSPFETTCDTCHATLLPDACFCHTCGTAIDSNKNDSPDVSRDVTRLQTLPERRQLTVMFCDLVGSSALSEQLDPEDLRRVIRTYQQTCGEVIDRYSGYVSRYMGDGILVFFGYPQAHEDAPVRAVLAGLDIIQAIKSLELNLNEQSIKLAVRIGISTGLVVAGDLIGEGSSEEKAVVGETPNIAARLQSLAQPNSILIHQTTADLCRNVIKLKSLGEKLLKGFTAAINIYEVEGVLDKTARFDKQFRPTALPLVGRDAEMDLLLNNWEKCQQENMRIILISSDPGYGKSRLIESFRKRIAQNTFEHLLFFCSPFHINSPLFAITDQIRKITLIDKIDDIETQLSKIEALMTSLDIELSHSVPLISDMLLIPYESRFQPQNWSAFEHKQKTLGLLVEICHIMSQQSPLLIVLEDAHWIDPTSLDLVNLLIQQLEQDKILLLISYRSEYHAQWEQLSSAIHLKLNRLTRNECQTLVTHIAGGKELPENVLQRIINKTDGVPLFIEEFTRTLIDSEQLQETPDGFILNGPLSPSAVPSSLQDSLVSRLDKLSHAKDLAQIASVIGRTFSSQLLHMACAKHGSEINLALTELLEANIIYRKGIASEELYEFRHALLQDAAYQSLLNTKRKEHHRKIAKTLIEHFADTVKQQPEVLAQHLTECDDIQQATTYWLQSGKKACEQSAPIEAISHLMAGIELIKKLPESLDRDLMELDFFLVLGPALMATRGFAVSEVEEAYVRGRELCHKVGTPMQYFTATWGLWLYRQQRGEVEIASKLSLELVDVANQQQDTVISLQAHHASWTTAFRMGHFKECYQHAEQGIKLYQFKQHQSLIHTYGGHDTGVCCLHHSAISRWVSGYPEQALIYAQRLQDLGKQIDHPFSKVHCLFFTAMINQILLNHEDVLKNALEAIHLCDQFRIAPQYYLPCRVLVGWVKVKTGQTREGIDEMREGLNIVQHEPTRAHEPYLQTLLSEVYLESNQLIECKEILDKSIQRIEETGEKTWLAEIYRLKGEYLVATKKQGDQAIAAFDDSMQLAVNQNALSFQLRTAISHAHLLHMSQKSAQAHGLLLNIHNQFTEGLLSADLKRSATLLKQLV